MRNEFSRLVTEASLKDGRVRVLMGDHGYALFDLLREKAPESLINCGVAEQNMIGVAAGLAKAGLVPIVYGLASFVPMRVLEQIRIDVCYENLPVVMIGDGAGVVYSTLGNTHQCFEDIAALRSIPNLTIFSPCDALEMRGCFESALKLPGPAYIRMGKGDLPKLHKMVPEFGPKAWGRPLPMRHDPDAESVMLATGSMVHTALRLSERMSQAGDSASVFSVPMIKPFSSQALRDLLKTQPKAKRLVTLEEHNSLGGLGSVVSELSTELLAPLPVLRLGIQDRFSKKAGSWEYLIREHGLDDESLIARLIVERPQSKQ